MEIQNLTAPTQSSSQTGDPGENQVNKMEFLQLLTTQLQHQDPLNPMDNTAFTAQLAQFSSLEQLTNLNSKISSLIDAQSGLVTLQALGFLGREVEVPIGTLPLTEGGTMPFQVRLSEEAEQAVVTISNTAGEPVAALDLGKRSVGAHPVEWDGLTADGLPAPAGDYHLTVGAVDLEGIPITAEILGRQAVTGIDLSGGEPRLLTDGGHIPLTSVHELR